MTDKLCRIKKAVPIFILGMAFFLLSCQPKPPLAVVKKTPVRVTPPVTPDFFAMAEQDFQAGNYDRAIKRYELYLSENPTRGQNPRTALYRIATINNNNHRYQEALGAFKRMMSEYPDHPENPNIAYDILNVHFQIGDYQASKTEALEWLKNYPHNPLNREVLFLLGRNFNALAHRPDAFLWWVKAIGRFSDLPDRQEDIDERIMGLIERGQIDELELMAQYGADSHYVPHIYNRLASIHMEEGRLEKAKYAAMALIRSTPEQYWVTIGRRILEKIEAVLSLRKGTIGCLLPLSGPFAIYGQEALNGIQLGMGLFDASESEQPLELIIKDTRGKVDDAVMGVEELVNEEKVMAIVGPLASRPAMAAAKRAEELGIPMITLTQKDGITREGGMIFRNFLTPSKEIEALLDKVMKEMKLKNFAIFYPDNPYGHFFMNLFWDRVEELNGKITAVESYKPDNTDFAAEIKKMVGLYYPRPESVVQMLNMMKMLEDKDEELDFNPVSVKEEPIDNDKTEEIVKEKDKEPEPLVDFDAVFIPDNHQQIALIAPQFPFYSIFNIHFLGTSLWQSSELIETTGNYLQGAIFPSGFYLDSPSDSVKDFVKKYKESFESEPGLLAANGYDTMRFLKNLIDSSLIESKEDFLEGLYQYDIYGITGRISFDHNGEVAKSPLLLTVSGKNFRILPPTITEH